MAIGETVIGETAIREMVEGDGPWAASLMAERRDEYEAYSPVFWRPNRGEGVVEFHGSFLGSVISDRDTVAVRSDRGFAIATPDDGGYYVDDFAVVDGRWTPDGAALLRAIWSTVGPGAEFLRVVTARRDRPKVDLLAGLGLAVGERWWVKPVRRGPEPPRELVIDGETGVGIDRPWVPPVYDPGGPVGVVTGIATAQGLAEAEAAAEGTDLVLLIVPAQPGSPVEDHVGAAGFDVASEFYRGTPRFA